MHDATDMMRLQSGSWISQQPEEFRAALSDILIWREVDAGSTINHAGDVNGGMWGVARGQVDLCAALSVTDSPISDIHLPGRWGGTGPIFGRPRAANGTVRTDALIAFAPLSRLQALLRDHPEWWECIGQLAIEYAYRYGGALGDSMIRDARQRCITMLLRLADCRHMDPAAPPTIILSQGDLAAVANMSRLPVGMVLRELDELGFIDHGYRQITIRNAPALRAIVEG
jgi:CRP-like cAMP-binding protein